MYFTKKINHKYNIFVYFLSNQKYYFTCKVVKNELNNHECAKSYKLENFSVFMKHRLFLSTYSGNHIFNY